MRRSMSMNVPVANSLNSGNSKASLIFVFHKDWNLVINMMIGVNKAIRAVWDADSHIMTKNDYIIKDVFQLNYDRSIDEKQQLKGTCSFSNYAPYVFANIRKAYGIDDEKVYTRVTSSSTASDLSR